MAMRLLSEDDEQPEQSIPMPDGVDADALEQLLADPQVVARIDEARDQFERDLIPTQTNRQ